MRVNMELRQVSPPRCLRSCACFQRGRADSASSLSQAEEKRIEVEGVAERAKLEVANLRAERELWKVRLPRPCRLAVLTG